MVSTPHSALQTVARRLAVYIEPSEIETVGFGPLEWLVSATARQENLTSILRPSRLAVALRPLLGSALKESLADSNLETLRHAAILAWHREQQTEEDLARFTAAGYGPAHRRLLHASVARDPGFVRSSLVNASATSGPSPFPPSVDLH